MVKSIIKKENSVEERMKSIDIIKPYYCREGISGRRNIKKIITVLLLLLPVIGIMLSMIGFSMNIIIYLLPAIIFSSTLVPNPTIIPDLEDIVYGLKQKGVIIEGWSCYNDRIPFIGKTSTGELITIENRGMIRVIITEASHHLPAPPSSKRRIKVKIIEKKDRIGHIRIDSTLINNITVFTVEMTTPSLYNPSIFTRYIGKAVVLEAQLRSRDRDRLIDLIEIALKTYKEGIDYAKELNLKTKESVKKILKKKRRTLHIPIHLFSK